MREVIARHVAMLINSPDYFWPRLAPQRHLSQLQVLFVPHSDTRNFEGVAAVAGRMSILLGVSTAAQPSRPPAADSLPA